MPSRQTKQSVSSTSDDDASTLQSSNIEAAVEEVLEARHYLVELDRRQHQLREAYRALRRFYESSTESVWLLCPGNTFVRSDLGTGNTTAYLQSRMCEGEREISDARVALKSKVATLASLEGGDGTLQRLFQGFDLTPT